MKRAVSGQPRQNISHRARQRRIHVFLQQNGIRLVSFMHYDFRYFDLEQKTLQPLDNPFGTRLSPMS